MPSKKLSSCPVYAMPHERQVELLSEALLREYMHKRRFTETLRAFDEENPRDGDTISSRALMSDLMSLDPDTQKSLKADGVETIMEMLCCLRLRRRLELEKLKQRALAEVPQTPEKAKRSSKRDKRGYVEKDSLEDLVCEKGLDNGVGKKKKNSISGGNISSWSNGSTGSLDVASSTNGAGSAGDNGPVNGREYDGVTNAGMDGACLGKGLVHSIMGLLCSENSLPKVFVEHGFYFLEEVEYGLCLESPGLDGIMAVVQAFICTHFFRNAFVDVKRHQEQCLLRALTTLILNAQPDPHAVCLVDGLIRAGSVEEDMMQLCLWRDFSTTQEVEKVLCSLLEERWMQPKGSGVFCFLLSVLLSRGIRDVASMMGCSGTLIDSRGRCSPELTKMLLRPAAGVSAAGGVLGGWIAGTGGGGMACGYVSSGPDDAMLDGEGAKTPRFPVWVLHHDGRCVVLFLKIDDRAQFERKKNLGRPSSSNVFFYSFTAVERCEMFLTVSFNSAAGVGQQAETDFSLICGLICKIPIWSCGDIDLNGFEPPL